MIDYKDLIETGVRIINLEDHKNLTWFGEEEVFYFPENKGIINMLRNWIKKWLGFDELRNAIDGINAALDAELDAKTFTENDIKEVHKLLIDLRDSIQILTSFANELQDDIKKIKGEDKPVNEMIKTNYIYKDITK